MILTIEIAQKIIAKQEKEFDSHSFIQTYQTDFEFDYLQDLFACIKSKNVIQDCHSKIGRFLRQHEQELNIKGDVKEPSSNIHGNKTNCEKWIKI